MNGTAIFQVKKGYLNSNTGYFIYTWIQSPV